MAEEVRPRKIGAGDAAPDFVLVDAWGHVRMLAPGRETTPALLVFFKATCPSCQLALPFVDRLFRRVEERPIRIWGIAQEQKVDANCFAVDFKIAFPLVLDSKPYRASQAYGITHVPTLYLVEPDGRVSRFIEGFVKRDYEELASHLGERLGVGPIALFAPGERVPALQPG